MSDRLRRDVDPQGIESATFRGTDEELAKALGFLDAKAAAEQFNIDIHKAVAVCKHQYGTALINEQVAFVRGFLANRGWNLDVDDAIVVLLTMSEEAMARALSEERPGS